MSRAQWYFLSGAMVGGAWVFLTPLPSGDPIQQGALGFVVGVVMLLIINIMAQV